MKKFYLLIAFIFLWGVALRSVEVLNKNYLFGFDVGRDLGVARSIVETRKVTLIGAQLGSGSAGIDGIFQGPGYYYLLAIPYILFRGDPYGALLTMFVFGVAALAAGYWTMKRMFGAACAAVGLFLVGISPLIVSQSRFIWAPHPASVFIVLSLYFTYMIAKKSRLYGPLAVLTAGLTYHFEFAMTIPMMIALFFAMPLIYRIRDVRTYVYSLATAIFVFLPLIAFEVRHGFMAFTSIISYTAPQGAAGRDVWILRFMDHVVPYIDNAKNSFISEHGLLPDWTFGVLCAGLIVAMIMFAIRAKETAVRKIFQFFVLLLLTSYGVLLLLNNSVWDYYLVHAHYIFIYIFAYTCVWAFKKSKIIFIILSLFLLSMAVSSAWRMKVSYTYDYYDVGGVEKIIGKKAAIDYVYKDAKGAPFSGFTFMAPIYTYPYDYLFATYGKQTYGYVPGTEKKGLVYLIIEPDMSKIWTYKGWLETVIVGGDIIKTVTLPTGQIIQVRQFP